MKAYPSEIPVVVIGGGPTGLTTANLLATHGLEFVVLERDPEPLDIPRAIVLDDEGTRTIQTFGLNETYLANVLEGVGSRYYDDDGRCFAETGAGPRNFGFAKRQYIHQPEFEAALRDRLQDRCPGALRFSSEVLSVESSETGATVQLRHADGGRHTIRANWVLACDGGRSPTREQLGIGMAGSTYEADWIVVDTADAPDRDPYSKFYCSRHRPAVSVPAPRGGRRYEFMLLPGETREQVLRDEFLARLLEPFRAYRPSDILRKTVYTFHARIADTFRSGRILLLGDAAHLTPPFAGQGMNAGLRDAHNVVWKIAAVEAGGASPDILDSYEQERRGPAWDMIQLAVAMGNVVMPSDQDHLAFRDLLMKALEPFPAVRDFLIQMRFKPKPRYATGLFLDLDTPLFEASMVGEMIPQPTLGRPAGRVLLDSELGPGFALIAQDPATGKALRALSRSTLAGLPLSKVDFPHLGPVALSNGEVIDALTARPMRTHRDQIMLVRPDRYCAAAFPPSELGSSLGRYEKLLDGGFRIDDSDQ